MKKDPPAGDDKRLWARVRRVARDSLAAELIEQVGKTISRRDDGPGADRLRDVPVASFGDVGGLADAKRELESVCLALTRPEAYRRWGARPPKGVLLYGPPGTGKTLLARCVAGQAKAAFFHIRAVDVSSMWYGQAEKRLQEAFDRARAQRPAVVFLDEVDALTPRREMAHEASHRVVSTLLENLDGLRPLEGVIVVAATNTPDSVDAALLRPGRLDRLVEVPLPDADARAQILHVHLRRAEHRAGRKLFELSDWQRIVRATDGMSGAEIEEIVRRTLEARVRLHDSHTDAPISEDELLLSARGFEWNKPGRAQRRGGWLNRP
jgi:transitional endoplasmic reticulum ATPase